MALLKTRPSIKLLAPPVIASGQPFLVRVILECPDPLPVNGVSVDLDGSEVWFSTSQYGRQRNESRFCRATALACGATELAPGRYEYDVNLEIPSRYPGTYSGSALRIEWVVRVHVDIPWWPDAHGSFVVNVVHPGARDARAGDKLVFVSSTGGPSGGAPYFEVMLQSREIEPGGSVRGAIALSNTQSNNYRAVEFKLIAVERLPSMLIENVFHNLVGHWRVATDKGEGEPMRFKLPLPDSIAPGFRTHAAGVEWFLAVEVDVPWKLDPRVWIPLNVRSRGLADAGIEPAAVAVGTERVQLIWREVARRTHFNHVDGVLRREFGHTVVELRREHQGRRGAIVVGEFVYPDLGIGLTRRGANALGARDPGQQAALASKLDDALADAGWPVEIDDRRMRFELKDSGHRVETLLAFVSRLKAVADAFEGACAELPAPAAVQAQMAEWIRAARALGGRLNRAAARVTARRAEIDLTLQAYFKPGGELDRYALEVRPKIPISERHHVDGPGVTLPASKLAERLVPVCEGAVALVIDWHRCLIELPAREFSVDRAATRLEQLATIAAKLSGRVGPYR